MLLISRDTTLIKYIPFFSVAIVVLFSQSAGLTTEQRLLNTNINRYLNNPDNSIQIIGSAKQQKNVVRWLDGIVRTQKGYATLQNIIESGHKLTIRHSVVARMSAGRTIAPMTENLINGQQNLYHELAHAMHKMQGTWRYFNSEQQAIEEENIFRQQLAVLNEEHTQLRFGKSGIPIESVSMAKITHVEQ
jgi:hypothetical protein